MYILYLLLAVISFLCLQYRLTKFSRNLILISWFISFLLLGTYAYYTDDYEPYVELVDKAYVTPFAYFHIEQFWIVLMEYFHGDINGFRFVSMVLLSISLVLIMIKSKVNAICFISFYTLLCLNSHICWIRQPLAYCLILLALIYYSQRKIFSIVFAFLLLFLALYVHKSSILLLCVVPFLFISVTKKKIFLIFVSLFPAIFVFFFIALSTLEAVLGINLEWYLEAENVYAERNIVFLIIANIITAIQFYIFGLTIYLFRNTSVLLERTLVRSLFGTVYISAFLLFLPFDANTIYVRLIAFGSFIVVVIWSKNPYLLKKMNKYKCIITFTALWFSLVLVSMLLNNYTRIDRLIKLPW
ncbi:EpsG family protein [Bacteroides fluxus]|uniref:EpsG family protein n=1 Tax=Bacteroides fluxus TaxID=626930 RepID=UPI0023A8BA62|nr:EpsG family protein [Bacteroides fluxus]